VLSAQLIKDGYDVEAVPSGTEALKALRENHVDVVVTDLRMPGIDGMELLKHVALEHPGVPVIMITAHGTVDTAVEALKLGAFDYVTKPFDKDEFRSVVRKAARTRDARQRDVAPVSRGARFRIIGRQPPMLDVYQVIEKVADTPSTVLITGESGTGKELIARALHEHEFGARFGSLHQRELRRHPPDLIESELFGYEKGAFTGAVTQARPLRARRRRHALPRRDRRSAGEHAGEAPPRHPGARAFERVGGIKTIRSMCAGRRHEPGSGGGHQGGAFPRRPLLPPERGADAPAAAARAQHDIPLLVEHFVRASTSA
jgi:two-component system response regulator AtoC